MSVADLPLVCCLCPSLARPKLLATAIACWANQFYEPRRLALLVGLDDDDDTTELTTQTLVEALKAYRPLARHHGLVRVERFDPNQSLPGKYNSMASRAAFHWDVDLFAVWEDDDLYLPAHCNAIASRWQAVNRPESWWAHPHHVWSDYYGITQPQLEEAPGRFHAALAVSRTMWERLPWRNTERADYDQQFLARLRSDRRPADYHTPGTQQPTYVFRWHTAHEHGQGSMEAPHDAGWRQQARTRLLTAARARPLQPFAIGFDPAARQLLDAVGVWRQLPDSGTPSESPLPT